MCDKFQEGVGHKKNAVHTLKKNFLQWAALVVLPSSTFSL